MTPAGIKLVWAGWHDDPVIGFSDRGCARWRDQIPPGTRMLVYETTGTAPGSSAKGTKSIVGEIEVVGTFEEGEALRAPTEEHARLLPVRVVRGRRDSHAIPLERVRALIDDPKWPRMGESWKPLSPDQYDALIAELG